MILYTHDKTRDRFNNLIFIPENARHSAAPQRSPYPRYPSRLLGPVRHPRGDDPDQPPRPGPRIPSPAAYPFAPTPSCASFTPRLESLRGVIVSNYFEWL